jgi:hypothetical protein
MGNGCGREWDKGRDGVRKWEMGVVGNGVRVRME